jgi:NADH dehydrogenase (ubiquinone) 1 alpha subcomplex subunit 9
VILAGLFSLYGPISGFVRHSPNRSSQEYDLRNTQSIEESVRHSDVVYNLTGRQYPTKNFSYADVHLDGAERIAEAVAKYDVDRFIHVSSYNARRDSPSEYFATKVR